MVNTSQRYSPLRFKLSQHRFLPKRQNLSTNDNYIAISRHTKVTVKVKSQRKKKENIFSMKRTPPTEKKDNRSFLTNMILLMSLQTNANKIIDFFTNITVKNWLHNMVRGRWCTWLKRVNIRAKTKFTETMYSAKLDIRKNGYLEVQ